MIVVFTLCSGNYMAQAKALAESVLEHNPKYHVVIGLVDRVPEGEDWAGSERYEILPIETLRLPDLSDMLNKYHIVELNTAVKPFYMEYLYQRDPNVEGVIYIDPDILLYASLERIEQRLREHSIILTPHASTFDDSSHNIYCELQMLSVGVYNLGFLATSRTDTTFQLLRWWKKRLRDYCYMDPGRGMFVDQLWMTLSTLYFPAYVEKDPGYNVSYWNQFERKLTQRNGRYFVNDQHELVFYHFSGYRPEHPDAVTKTGQQTVTFSERPELRPLYDDYRNRLMSSGYASSRGAAFFGKPKPKPKFHLRTAVKDSIRTGLRKLPTGYQASAMKLATFTLRCLR